MKTSLSATSLFGKLVNVRAETTNIRVLRKMYCHGRMLIGLLDGAMFEDYACALELQRQWSGQSVRG